MTEEEMRERLMGEVSLDVVAARLDDFGITLTNFRDPEDGSTVPGIDWRQAIVLANEVNAARGREARADIETVLSDGMNEYRPIPQWASKALRSVALP